MSLSETQIEQFIECGFVRVEAAVPMNTALHCQRELWEEIHLDPSDPSTWTDTLVRVPHLATPAFQEAATSPQLHTAFDQLVGAGRWHPRIGLGTFPLRFPGPGGAKEAGWHLEASFADVDGTHRVNLRSRGRALLVLFLFSEVGPTDAPTLIRVGSHLDVPRFLAPAGNDGRDWFSLCADVVPATQHRPVAAAVGSPGDVYLCHPFLVHSAQEHHGRVPRFMAQPPLEPTGLLDLASTDPTPVEQAVLKGLGRTPDAS